MTVTQRTVLLIFLTLSVWNSCFAQQRSLKVSKKQVFEMFLKTREIASKNGYKVVLTGSGFVLASVVAEVAILFKRDPFYAGTVAQEIKYNNNTISFRNEIAELKSEILTKSSELQSMNKKALYEKAKQYLLTLAKEGKQQEIARRFANTMVKNTYDTKTVIDLAMSEPSALEKSLASRDVKEQAKILKQEVKGDIRGLKAERWRLKKVFFRHNFFTLDGFAKNISRPIFRIGLGFLALGGSMMLLGRGYKHDDRKEKHIEGRKGAVDLTNKLAFAAYLKSDPSKILEIVAMYEGMKKLRDLNAHVFTGYLIHKLQKKRNLKNSKGLIRIFPKKTDLNRI